MKGIIFIFSSRACGGGDLVMDKPSYVHSKSSPPLPFLQSPPPFILSWGSLDSLSSSTSFHHGEKRPVIFLSSSISSISSCLLYTSCLSILEAAGGVSLRYGVRCAARKFNHSWCRSLVRFLVPTSVGAEIRVRGNPFSNSMDAAESFSLYGAFIKYSPRAAQYASVLCFRGQRKPGRLAR